MHDDPRPGSIPEVQRTAPERIYLCVSDDLADRDEPFPSANQADWSRDEATRVAVPYVRADLAALAAPKAEAPEFTDTARAALLWVLWHHQGASSKIGQAMRFALGMGAHDRLDDHQVSEAKRWAALAPTSPAPQEES